MKRVGLFVGIDDYQNGITKLQCAVNDAKSLSFAFNSAGFTPSLMQNSECSGDNILARAAELTADLEPGDIFLFYFSGHGREVNGTHYLVGATGYANSALYTMGTVQLPALIEITNRVPGLNRLFILDCCRSNLLADRAGAFACTNTRDIALEAAVTPGADRSIIPPLILSSCSTGEQAFEDTNLKHGYFTRTLLKVLENKNINSFRKFRESLQITGTPAPQNVSWNGNLNFWENISLLKSWENASESTSETETKVDNSELDRYRAEALYAEVSALINSSGSQPSWEFKAAEKAWKDEDFTVASQLFKQAKESLEKAISEAAKAKEKAEAEAKIAKEKAEAEAAKAKEKAAAEARAQKAVPVAAAGQTPEQKSALDAGIRFSADFTVLISAPKDIAFCIVPAGVKKIGDGAFDGCMNLRKMVLPEGLEELGDRAFRDCRGLLLVRFPRTLTAIGKYAFEGCISLGCLKLPPRITKIDDYAFQGCVKITSLRLPDTINFVGNNIACECKSLTWIRIPEGLKWRRNEIFGLGTFTFFLIEVRKFLFVLIVLLFCYWYVVVFGVIVSLPGKVLTGLGD